MSYILEALRKSEQARKGLSVPDLSTVAGAPVAVERLRTRLLWPLLALVLVAVNAAGLAWWLQRPRPGAQPPPPAPPALAAPAPAPAPPSLEQTLERLAADLPPQPVPIAVTAAEPAAPRPPAPAPAAPPPGAESPPQNPSPPVAVPAELPPLAIGGYIQGAEGGAGMVMVNERLVQEGEEVLPGLRVEEVMADGVTFSYRGRRFRR